MSIAGLAIAVSVTGVFVSFCLTILVRQHAVSSRMLDVPNARSSHHVPIPRGGGLAIVIVLLAGLAVGRFSGWLSSSETLGMGVGMAAVAAAGWLDDRKGLPAGLRLCVHFAAAAWVVWWLGGLHLVKFGAASVTLGPFGTIVAVVAIVWMTNLYNFMDGIDGIAASEAVVTGLVGGTLLLMSNSIGLGLLALLTAGAAAGFLLLNWPPARIFMGDVGSGSLGFLFASIALDSEHHGGVPFVLWLILLSLFIGDATITLVRRFVAGERIGEAHKSHAYQRALLNARGHSDVLVAVCTINAVLAMLTICAWQAPSFTLAAVGVAAFVVILFYLLVESKAPFGKTSSGKS